MRVRIGQGGFGNVIENAQFRVLINTLFSCSNHIRVKMKFGRRSGATKVRRGYLVFMDEESAYFLAKDKWLGKRFHQTMLLVRDEEEARKLLITRTSLTGRLSSSWTVEKQSAAMERVSSLFPHLVECMARSWRLQFFHVVREGNQAADHMAKLAWGWKYGLKVFTTPPTEVLAIVQDDCRVEA
ncbi:hypothetical protein F3Y22_tig00008262pilonHSYRG00043 [Hibiscus syriacus]|uniref:RNase H type-1 domain-containing protein n=1 Tax=Hibiscus syriacus TaxID=106335 RepID=A0A6A3C8T7_HIBSY|nr:hypothetical protein F3Y22_tig00008262pilonHSYRG00043 [Hibiscus syriacus]